MVNFIMIISVMLLIIFLYVISYLLNQKIEVPEVCRIAMEESGCNSCDISESCTSDLKISFYEEYKKGERNE